MSSASGLGPGGDDAPSGSQRKKSESRVLSSKLSAAAKALEKSAVKLATTYKGSRVLLIVMAPTRKCPVSLHAGFSKTQQQAGELNRQIHNHLAKVEGWELVSESPSSLVTEENLAAVRVVLQAAQEKGILAARQAEAIEIEVIQGQPAALGE